ncbi:MAG: S1 RNA-binding domain-containing protein [Anaerolineae bacterium]|nr:S1 RNA-binding domain-containing protein [Anaerolineae bacterium]
MSEQIDTQPTSIQELQPKMRLAGTITRTELYGAFVNVGLERDGLIHISHLAPKRVKKVTDQVKVGDEVTVWVLSVDADKGRVALTMVEPPDVDWDELEVGQIHQGKVVRIERYGAFVDIGAERPGLLHVREMGQYVQNPTDVVKVGEAIEVKVSNLDRRKRQLDFTIQMDADDIEDDEEDDIPMLSAMEIAFQQAGANNTSRRRRQQQRRSNRRSDYDEFENIYRRTLNQD